MRPLILLLMLGGCTLFDPPVSSPQSISPQAQAIVLEWALWAPRPRAQYGYSEPQVIYQPNRFIFGYDAGQTRNFILY